tara:strand:+ start:540 stop:908 length:369 start_codon:yes stop_codon:yes gene_type:complete
MRFEQSFVFDTAHAAGTYTELATINGKNVCLTSLIVQNKSGGDTDVSIKIQHLASDGTTTTDLEVIESITLSTTRTYNFMNEGNTGSLGLNELFIPHNSKIFVKSSVLNAINVVATFKHYQQ